MHQGKNGLTGARILRTASLILVDIIAIYVSLYIAYMFRKHIAVQLFANRPAFPHSYFYYVNLFWIPIAYLFLTSYHGLYSSTRTFWEDAREYVKSSVISLILILTIATLYRKEGQYISRMIMIVYILNIIWFNLLLRVVIVRALHSKRVFRKNIVIIGAGRTGRDLANALSKERYLGYEVLGFIDDDPKKWGRTIGGLKVLGKTDDINNDNLLNYIDKIFIAIPSLTSDKLMKLYAKLHVHCKEVVIIPQIKGMALTNSEMHHLFNYDLPLLHVKNNFSYTANNVLKSLLDYVLVLMFLPFFLLLLFFISLAIILESRGPVFYKHTRYAMNGKQIRVFKFRSMYNNADARLKDLLENNEQLRAEWRQNYKLHDDPRVTRVGKVLRKSSLDELPQIINVMKGEMSFIGPRPVIKREFNRYYVHFSDYFSKVKPGITGLWQVSGRSNTKYDFRVRTDLWYVLNWSLWLDVVILFKTVGVVIRGSGAY